MSQLAELLERLDLPGGFVESPLEGVRLFKSVQHIPRTPLIYDPGICISGAHERIRLPSGVRGGDLRVAHAVSLKKVSLTKARDFIVQEEMKVYLAADRVGYESPFPVQPRVQALLRIESGGYGAGVLPNRPPLFDVFYDLTRHQVFLGAFGHEVGGIALSPVEKGFQNRDERLPDRGEEVLHLGRDLPSSPTTRPSSPTSATTPSPSEGPPTFPWS